MTPSILLPWLQVGGLSVAVLLLIVGGRWAVAWLRARAEHSRLALFGAVVGDHLVAGFTEIEASLRPKLAGVLADGRITEEEALVLRKALVEQVLQTMPAHIKAIGTALFGDMLSKVLAVKVDEVAKALPSVVPTSSTAWPPAPVNPLMPRGEK